VSQSNTFVIGDTVRLKSDNVRMMIDAITSDMNGKTLYRCIWYDSFTRLQIYAFHPALLVRIAD